MYIWRAFNSRCREGCLHQWVMGPYWQSSYTSRRKIFFLAIINVDTNETWAYLKVLVPYNWYWYPNGLTDFRVQIEVENEGVVTPPFFIRWIRSVRTVEQHFQAGCLPQNMAWVVFKRPGKVAA